ncbi:unnamed protein product [Phaeothamnion confervicola]
MMSYPPLAQGTISEFGRNDVPPRGCPGFHPAAGTGGLVLPGPAVPGGGGSRVGAIGGGMCRSDFVMPPTGSIGPRPGDVGAYSGRYRIVAAQADGVHLRSPDLAGAVVAATASFTRPMKPEFDPMSPMLTLTPTMVAMAAGLSGFSPAPSGSTLPAVSGGLVGGGVGRGAGAGRSGDRSVAAASMLPLASVISSAASRKAASKTAATLSAITGLNDVAGAKASFGTGRSTRGATAAAAAAAAADSKLLIGATGPKLGMAGGSSVGSGAGGGGGGGAGADGGGGAGIGSDTDGDGINAVVASAGGSGGGGISGSSAGGGGRPSCGALTRRRTAKAATNVAAATAAPEAPSEAENL